MIGQTAIALEHVARIVRRVDERERQQLPVQRLGARARPRRAKPREERHRVEQPHVAAERRDPLGREHLHELVARRHPALRHGRSEGHAGDEVVPAARREFEIGRQMDGVVRACLLAEAAEETACEIELPPTCLGPDLIERDRPHLALHNDLPATQTGRVLTQ